MLVDVLGVAAATGGVVIGLSPALIVLRILRTGSSRDVSLGYLAVRFGGQSVWLAYGVALGSAVIAVPNAVAVVVVAFTAAVVVAHRPGPPAGRVVPLTGRRRGAAPTAPAAAPTAPPAPPPPP